MKEFLYLPSESLSLFLSVCIKRKKYTWMPSQLYEYSIAIIILSNKPLQNLISLEQ